jgi:enoyl-CoA hydratase
MLAGAAMRRIRRSAARKRRPLARVRAGGFASMAVSYACASRATGEPTMAFSCILTETRDRVAIITLNRPQRLNALSDALAAELATALHGFDADPGISVIVVTGSEKAFAAGADIGAMADWDYAKVYGDDYITKNFEAMREVRKPVIAAVAGYALGGGCELAMMCDMIVAADTAKFGQPEITIGTMPGMGGTQRLPRAIGKAKAMDWCLTGRTVDAAEAERAGLVARVVPADKLMEETLSIAARIASFSLPVVLKVKEAINRAYESSLAEGLLFERREFHATFALDDRKEGMRAFVEKRKPAFRHR